jgi:hypothetical protein
MKSLTHRSYFCLPRSCNFGQGPKCKKISIGNNYIMYGIEIMLQKIMQNCCNSFVATEIYRKRLLRKLASCFCAFVVKYSSRCPWRVLAWEFYIRYNPAMRSQVLLQGELDRIVWFNNGAFAPLKSLQD